MSDEKWAHGRFVWRELHTSDPVASARFYGELFDWRVHEMPMPDGDVYRMWFAGDHPVGGLAWNATRPAHWLPYVSVPDVDAAALRARENGARLEGLPYEVGSAGRLAVLHDPQGARIAAWKSAGGDGAPPARFGVGQFCWEELATDDLLGAAAFYQAMFGWIQRPFTGGGGMSVFASGDHEVASILTANGQSRWLSYVVVPKIFDTHQRTRRLGGSVVVESMRVPGVGTIAVINDLRGAPLGLFEAP